MTPYYADSWLTVYAGDCRAVMASMEPESVHCVVTSPPYWGLRDYGTTGQLGLEPTPEEYVANLVDVFREVRRVLRADGTVWLNLGDSYASQGGLHDGRDDNQPGVGASRAWRNGSGRADGIVDGRGQRNRNGNAVPGLKPKDLVGIPWRVAFALQADGWYLRSDIIWAKPNPMPESVTDRPTKSHEYLFLLSKSPRYYYDADAVRIPAAPASESRWAQNVEAQAGSERVPGKTNGTMKAVGGPRRTDKQRGHSRRHAGFNDRWDTMERAEQIAGGANLRSVWTIATQPYPGAHFATFPRKLVVPCIKAGSPEGGVVLDCFAGSGTTGLVAQSLSRRAVLIDLNADYLIQAMGRNRDIPLGLVG